MKPSPVKSAGTLDYNPNLWRCVLWNGWRPSFPGLDTAKKPAVSIPPVTVYFACFDDRSPDRAHASSQCLRPQPGLQLAQGKARSFGVDRFLMLLVLSCNLLSDGDWWLIESLRHPLICRWTDKLVFFKEMKRVLDELKAGRDVITTPVIETPAEVKAD